MAMETSKQYEIDASAHATYLKKLGKRILSEANDLKRTPEALANDLNYDFNLVQSIIDGNSSVDVAQGFIARMCDVYPISITNIWVDMDDTDQGVKIMRAQNSENSSRKFTRINRSGEQTPYYEYRDTAMSRTADFKPEWILPLRVVEDDDPNNPDVVYNNGHLMHQCTFFIGAVNFYWEVDGEKYSSEMNTGDSNYITPFIPHSFTSRDPDDLGLIIAVTFGGSVRHALNEFSQIGSLGIDAMVDDLSNPIDAFSSRLGRYLKADSLSPAQFAGRLTEIGIDRVTASEISSGEIVPSSEQLKIVAQALNVRPEDLMVSPVNSGEMVVVTKSFSSALRAYPSANRPVYYLRELSRSCHQPGLRGLDITVLKEAGDKEADFCHSLHQYVYNYGKTPAQIVWGEVKTEILEPGDSAYISPMISHRFECLKFNSPAHLVVVRIPGTLTDSTINEFSRFPTDRRSRVSEETYKWF
jgi:transcriptional regulator with XRE-family HTH domain/uncharacterized RmlC-like cupin family protein